MSVIKRVAVGLSVCLSAATASMAFAQDQGSDSVSLKVDAFGGDIGGESTFNSSASLTGKVGSQFEFQLDGLIGDVGGSTLKGAGLQLFWRDSEVGLLGASVATASLRGASVDQYSLIGERYWSDISLLGELGQLSSSVVSEDFASVSLRYYPNPDLMLGTSGELSDDQLIGTGSVEFLLPGSQLALIGDLTLGNTGSESVLMGVRYYFGEAKPLMRLHREDDPPIRLFRSARIAARETVCPLTTTYEERGPVCPLGLECPAVVSPVLVTRNCRGDELSVVDTPARP